jgi:hypothetical protein
MSRVEWERVRNKSREEDRGKAQEFRRLSGKRKCKSYLWRAASRGMRGECVGVLRVEE